MRHLAHGLFLHGCLTAFIGLTTGAAGADLGGGYGGPVGPYGPPPGPGFYAGAFADPGLVPGRPARRLRSSPDYAGTEYGLARPSFYGMAPRPDWGRSSID